MDSENTAPVRSPLSYCDDAGPVYFTACSVLRAVPASSEKRIRAMIASGLTDKLAEMDLMPTTRVSTQQLPEAAMVIEHPRLPYVIYPYEWSYGMLREAAVCVLEVNRIANTYGYELADCHGFNVVFDGAKPKYVDLGSLVPLPRKDRAWAGLEEFVRFYEYPLRIWRDGGGYIARRLIAASNIMEHSDYGLYRWPWLRMGAASRYNKCMHWWYRYKESSRMPPERIQARMPYGLRGITSKLLRAGILPGQGVDLVGVRKRIIRWKRRGKEGFWSQYQSENPSSVNTPRFHRIAKIIASEGLRSVIELAANQGFFCDFLLTSRCVQSAVSTDADEWAVDRAFLRAQKSNTGLLTAVIDFVHPMAAPFGEAPARRLQCDGVVALAITHHLLLTQKIPITKIFDVISAYANRFVVVEFMPLGLWDGRHAPPVPDWYKLDWFRSEFIKRFEKTHDESLEENRHMFCGRIRPKD